MHMSPTVAVTETKNMMNLIMTRKARVKNKLKRTKSTIIKKTNRRNTLNQRYLMKKGTLKMLMTRKLQTVMMLK